MDFKLSAIRTIRDRKDVSVEPYQLAIMRSGSYGFTVSAGSQSEGNFTAIYSSPVDFASEESARATGKAYVEAVRAMTPQQVSDLERAAANGHGSVFGTMQRR